MMNYELSVRGKGVGAVDVEGRGRCKVVAGGGEVEREVEFGEEGGGGEDFDADEAREEVGDGIIPARWRNAGVQMVEEREEEDAGAAGGIEQKWGMRSRPAMRVPRCGVGGEATW